VPALGAWLVTGYPQAVAVLRDARTFTVDDPRFSTARVVGPSMLSLDGAAHGRHRAPFTDAFRAATVRARLETYTRAEADRLVRAIAPQGSGELRRAVAGPLAVAVIAEALGLRDTDPAKILAWYDGIVSAVQAAQAGPDPIPSEAFADLAASLSEALPGSPLLAGVTDALGEEEAISNAAVLMFGGIETTEGMIANVMLHLLANPEALATVRSDPGLVPAAIEESLRLEPAAAVVDRYATADTRLGERDGTQDGAGDGTRDGAGNGVRIRAGDQVTVSIAGANRDPAIFADPDRFDIRRPNAARHLAFAHGPHFCLGAHLARLEARAAVAALLSRLPRLRLDPAHPAAPRGLVFRKPPDLRVRWDVPGEGCAQSAATERR
jgi:cytochrome P450